MINAAGIPTIPGDMDALAGHARALGQTGAAFADTGARVNATWQGLAGVYNAPEAGLLLTATVPVQQVAGSVGDDLETAGSALATYAAEVREIQARLETLRAQAGEFERSVTGDDDWADDDAQRERNNELVAAVSAAIADFDDAQRRCANAINARYGGQQYRADNGDGQFEPGEYGYTAEQYGQAAAGEAGVPWGRTAADDPGWLSSLGHTALDVAGLVPVIGEAADGINAAWYAAEGDYTNAALSAAAMVPFAGWAATGGRFALKGTDAVRTSLAAHQAPISRHGLAAPVRGANGPGVPAPFAGQPVYRVWGQNQDAAGHMMPSGARPSGQSWTPAHPAESPNYRTDAGLPNENPGRFISEGVLRKPENVVEVRPALPLDGNPGGWPEYVIENADDAVDLVRVGGVNEPWTHQPGDWVPPSTP